MRGLGAEARALADRHFMETVVRLHRAGESASCTGLQPAGTGYGPAIPAAERALETGQAGPRLGLLIQDLGLQVAEQPERARTHEGAPAEPHGAAQVAAARERLSQEFAFIGYAGASTRRWRAASTARRAPRAIMIRLRA